MNVILQQPVRSRVRRLKPIDSERVSEATQSFRDKLRERLTHLGYEVVDDPAGADAVVHGSLELFRYRAGFGRHAAQVMADVSFVGPEGDEVYYVVALQKPISNAWPTIVTRASARAKNVADVFAAACESSDDTKKHD